MGNKSIFSTASSSFKYSSSTYYLTDLSYNEAYDRIEVTDTSTTGDGKEYKSGRAERSFTVDVMYDTASADIPLNTAAAITASFEGKTYIGTGALYSKTITGTIDGVISATYEGAFSGLVTPSV